MSYDELELDKLGDEKSALFFLISDTDTTYNFLVALAFSQMFNLLCERADNTYGGRLPYHVRVLWDEAANTGQVPGLEKIVAVIRSREISLTLFYQAMSNVIEVKARGASVLALTTENRREALSSRVDGILTIPETELPLLPLLGVVPLQLFAYYVALQRGCDIDKPRNLAKSVTVE